MRRNSEGRHQHTIDMGEVNDDHLALMEAKLLIMPKLLRDCAGHSSCCIFRVAQSQVQLNRYAYYPQVVSIGPYHYKEQHLKMIQEHKWRFLASLISRTRRQGLGLKDYLKAIKDLEESARRCYSEVINLQSDEFVEIMVLDGCFIIEFFRMLCDVVEMGEDDPIFSLSWLCASVLRDLIKLENQIPFFILQTLFDLSNTPEEANPSPGPDLSLVTLALTPFTNFEGIPESAIEQCQNLDPEHLHGLLRSSMIPENLLAIPPSLSSTYPTTQNINCVSKLRQAGIKFKVGNSNSFLDIKFQRGVLEMPIVSIHDFIGPFFLNCVAFEQSYKHCSSHFTTYATLMDCLINTHKDVEFLCDSGIIENYFGADGDVSRLFNTMGKDLILDVPNSYLADLFDDVNQYYRNNWHVQWASFKYTYFSTPWSFISALAAAVLLVLTVAQTFYTVISYYR